jgi:3-hydroxymyristoyl/3-hydroxydecanoyl-(acyl carrier protein) dehydratase
MRFRFVDRVVSFENGPRPRLVTAKFFPRLDDFTAGHPQRPGEIPNCLILEAMATAGVRLVHLHKEGGTVGLLLRVEEARIMAAVGAGEELLVDSELQGMQPQAHESVGLARVLAKATVGDRVVAEASLLLFCFPQDGFESSLPW